MILEKLYLAIILDDLIEKIIELKSEPLVTLKLIQHGFI